MIVWFFIWRCVDFLLSFIAQLILPSTHNYMYFMGHKENILHIPNFIFAFANFDGANYIDIARDGYGTYQQTYFPLFPLLAHILSPLFFGNYFLAGLLISNISFYIGLLYLRRYLKLLKIDNISVIWFFLFLLTFPTSFFFGAVYTEGLFFLFLIGSLYFMETKEYVKLTAFAFFAALTRLLGIFLIIPMIATFYLGHKHVRKFMLQKPAYLIILIAPFLGLGLYMLYLSQTIHDPLGFYHAELNFNTGRSTHIILLPQVYYRYFRIFFSADHTLSYFIAVVEFIIFNLVFFVLVYDLWLLWKKKDIPARFSLIGLNLFSFANILLPTFTGTFSSIPRYALFSLSFFLRIAQIKNKSIKISLLVIFVILHIVLISLFVQGYFIG